MDTQGNLLIGGLVGLLIILIWLSIAGRNKRKTWLKQVEAMKGTWPTAIVDYLLSHPQCESISDLHSLMAHRPEWSDEVLLSIVSKQVSIGMTAEMVLSSWGNPTEIQNKEITRNGKKTRWVYGIPRRGAQYLWFTDDELTKIGN